MKVVRCIKLAQPVTVMKQIFRLTFVRRPSLECGSVSSSGGEVAVVQPIDHPLFLAQSGPSLPVVEAELVRAHGKGIALVRRLRVVRLDPAAADEEHVADLDISALGGGTDVNALVQAALVELLLLVSMKVVKTGAGETHFVADWVVVVRIILYALLLCITSVIEQDATTSNAMLGPMVDTAFMARIGPVGCDDVSALGLQTVSSGIRKRGVASYVIVEGTCLNPRELQAVSRGAGKAHDLNLHDGSRPIGSLTVCSARIHRRRQCFRRGF